MPNGSVHRPARRLAPSFGFVVVPIFGLSCAESANNSLEYAKAVFFAHGAWIAPDEVPKMMIPSPVLLATARTELLVPAQIMEEVRDRVEHLMAGELDDIGDEIRWGYRVPSIGSNGSVVVVQSTAVSFPSSLVDFACASRLGRPPQDESGFLVTLKLAFVPVYSELAIRDKDGSWRGAFEVDLDEWNKVRSSTRVGVLRGCYEASGASLVLELRHYFNRASVFQNDAALGTHRWNRKSADVAYWFDKLNRRVGVRGTTDYLHWVGTLQAAWGPHGGAGQVMATNFDNGLPVHFEECWSADLVTTYFRGPPEVQVPSTGTSTLCLERLAPQ